jgi:hypothetical protein
MRTVKDALRLRSRLEEGNVRSVLVVGASMVGIKAAELLTNSGARTTLADMAGRIFPQAALPDIAALIEILAVQCQQAHSLDRCRLVILGAGTGGSVASWFHQKYPQFSTGAWIASSPLAAASELPQIDSLVGRRIRQLSDDCLISVRAILASAESLSLLNLSAQVLSDVIEKVVLNDSFSDDLAEFCVAPTIPALAVLFQTALTKLGIPSASSLDLWEVADDGFSVNRHAELWMQCREVGWFRTASGDGIRPASLNLSYYRELCKSQFGHTNPRIASFNREFGGRTPTMTSVVFTGARDDSFASVTADSAVVPGSINESFWFEVAARDDGVFRRAGVANKTIFDPIQQWVNFSCRSCSRTHGSCFLHGCVCDSGWGTRDGAKEQCGESQVGYNDMMTIEVVATILPTGLVLAIGFVTWWVLIRSKSTGSPEGSGSTTRGRWSGNFKPTVQI